MCTRELINGQSAIALNHANSVGYWWLGSDNTTQVNYCLLGGTCEGVTATLSSGSFTHWLFGDNYHFTIGSFIIITE